MNFLMIVCCHKSYAFSCITSATSLKNKKEIIHNFNFKYAGFVSKLPYTGFCLTAFNFLNDPKTKKS